MRKKYVVRKGIAGLLALSMVCSFFSASVMAGENAAALDLPIPIIDTDTHGNWVGTYGTDGYVLCAYENDSYPDASQGTPDQLCEDRMSIPEYVNSIEYVYESKTNNAGDSGYRYGWWVRDNDYSSSAAKLAGGPGSAEEKLHYRFDDRSITVNVDVKDEKEHTLSLYFAEEGARVMTVQAFKADGSTEVSNPVQIDSIVDGKYVTIPFSGDVSVKITNDAYTNAGGYSPMNAVLNGIFFDSLELASISISAEDGEVVRSVNDVFTMKVQTVPSTVNAPEVDWSVTDLDGKATDVAEISTEGVVSVKKGVGNFRVTAVNRENKEMSASAEFVVIGSGEELPAETAISHAGNLDIIENGTSKVIFNRATGTYSAYSQTNGKAYVLNARMQVGDQISTDGYKFTASEVDIKTALTTVTPETSLIKGKQGPVAETAENVKGKTLRLTGEKAGEASIVFDITLQDDKTGIILRPGIINNTGEDMRIKEMYPLIAYGAYGGGIFAGPDPTVNHNAMSGNSVWGAPSLIDGVNMGDARNNMLISYRNNPEKESISMGAITTYEFRSQFATSFQPDACVENKGRKSIDARMRLFDSRGKLVDKNSSEPYMFDQAYIDFAEQNPYDSLEKFADEQARAMNVNLLEIDPYFYECLWWAQGGHVDNPDMGWGLGGGVGYGNTADFAVDEAGRAKEKGLTQYAAPSLRVEPDRYTRNNEQLWWNDEKWKECGHLTENYPTLKLWNNKMHELGAEAGLYMQPTYRSEDFCEQYPQYMMNNEKYYNADYTDSEYIRYLENSVYANMRDAGLTSLFYDYSGTYNYRTKEETGWKSTQWYAEDHKWVADLPWKYLLDISEGYEDPYATAVSAYRNIFAIPKNVVGNQLQICENIWQDAGDDVAIGLIDSQRSVVDDTSFGLPLIKKGVYQWYKNRTTKMIYPDAKILNQSDRDVRRGQVTGMAMMFGKPTLAHSIEEKNMSDEAIYDFSRTLPMPNNGVSARPLGLFELAGVQGDVTKAVGEAYDYKLADDNHILLLWNHTGAEKKIGVDLGEDTAFGGMGLDPEKTYHVWDFWNWQYIGEVSGSEYLELSTRANECKVLAVREVKEGTPALLSTDRHILQGELDAEVDEYNPESMTLTGTFDVIGEDGFDGDVYRAVFALPEGTTLDTFETEAKDAEISTEISDFDGLLEVTVDTEESYDGTENPPLRWTLTLKEKEINDTEAPSDVTGVRVSADLRGNVTLNWNESKDNSGLVRYRVYRGTAPDAVNELAADNLDETTCTVAGEGTVYYRIEAYDPSGNTAGSETVMAEVAAREERNASGATATSSYVGGAYEAGNVLDGNPNTIWHTSDENKNGERSITIRLENPGRINTLKYLPRQDASDNGVITKYEIQVSEDGINFRTVSEGQWENDRTWKNALFTDADNVSYVKLIAVESVNDYAAAAEIIVSYMPNELSGIGVSDTAVQLNTGESRQVYANLYPSHMSGIELIWDTADENVAEVDENGVITAAGTGTTTITVRIPSTDFYAECSVTVQDDPVQNLDKLKELLKLAIESAEAIVPDLETQYMPEGQDEFKEALDHAKDVYNNKELTAGNPEHKQMIKDARERLLDAMSSLKLKEESGITGPQDDEKPGDDGQKPDADTDSGKAVKTGDASQPFIYVTLLALASGAAAVILRKKRNK